MNSCYVHHNTGLGDHIICNGLVRYLIKKHNYDEVLLVVKHHNLNNVRRMFRDLRQIRYIGINTDDDVKYKSDIHLHRIGIDGVDINCFDRSFYDQAGVPFPERWDSWFIERDKEREDALFNSLLIDGDYIFVHDVSSKGVRNLKIESNLRQIKPTKSPEESSIFDWLKVIENAKEIHVINSSFVHIINSLEIECKLHYHDKDVSVPCNIECFTLHGKWNIVKYN